jgi:hypothetical protein
MDAKNMKKEKIPLTKWEFGAFIINHWIKVIILLCISGIIVSILQIKSIQCGDAKIEKQPLKTQFKK